MLSTGRQDTVLVVAGDVSTKQLDLTTKPATEPERAGRDAAALGDAAAAVVVTTRGCPDAYLLHRVHVRQGSAGHRPGRTAGWLGAAERGTRGQIVTYDPELIAAVAPKLAGDVLTEVLDGLGWRPEDLARLLPPQLPGGVAEVTAGLLGVPAERCSDRIGRLGDAANALPLFQLAHAHPRTGAGDRVAGVAVDPSGWAVADFALRRVR
jgi:3-oxoacyl-[acyl-carrier-protein] synthase-3